MTPPNGSGADGNTDLGGALLGGGWSTVVTPDQVIRMSVHTCSTMIAQVHRTTPMLVKRTTPPRRRTGRVNGAGTTAEQNGVKATRAVLVVASLIPALCDISATTSDTSLSCLWPWAVK